MNIGMQDHCCGAGRWKAFVSQARNEIRNELRNEPSGMSRGERIVGRLDQDGDGKLGLNELADSRLGRNMSVARMAKMDANGDGMLEASEFRGRGGNDSVPGAAAETSQPPAVLPIPSAAKSENAIVAQMADYYTETVSLEDKVNARAAALADEIVKRLDADGSGRLNTEEIAGTRLAEKIGEGFFELDADRNGGLDVDELFGFLFEEIMTLAEERGLMPGEAEAPEADGLAGAAGAEAVEPVSATGDEAVVELVEEAASASDLDEVEEGDAAEAVEESAAAATTAASDFELTAEDLIKTAFENALKMIQEGQENRSTYDVVSALYGNVKGIFDAV